MISDQLLSQIIDAVLPLEILAAVVSIFYLKKYSKTRLKYFFLYLLLIAITESLGLWMYKTGRDNTLLYNISKPIQYNYILFLLLSYLQLPVFRKSLKILIIIFNLALIINMVIGNGPLVEQPTFAFTLSSLIISVAIFAFFYESVRTEMVLKMSRYLIVWICAGLLIFHLVTLPLFAFANSMEYIAPGSNSLLLIKVFTNIFMYVSFTIGYIWSQEYYPS